MEEQIVGRTLVTGGTGTLGSLVVPLLRRDGHVVRVLTRQDRGSSGGVEHVRGDLVTGEGVAAAVEGVRTVVHLAGGPKGDDIAAGNLANAMATADVAHVLHISVIGADRVPLGYFRRKAAAEEAIAGSGVPWTILRAAQFHELVSRMVEALTRLPVVPAPGGVRLEPVAAFEVADRIAALASGDPAGAVPELAGPEVADIPTLARTYLEVAGRRRAIMPVPLLGRAGRAYREGANLASGTAPRGRCTWRGFLAGSAGERRSGFDALG